MANVTCHTTCVKGFTFPYVLIQVAWHVHLYYTAAFIAYGILKIVGVMSKGNQLLINVLSFDSDTIVAQGKCQKASGNRHRHVAW